MRTSFASNVPSLPTSHAMSFPQQKPRRGRGVSHAKSVHSSVTGTRCCNQQSFISYAGSIFSSGRPMLLTRHAPVAFDRYRKETLTMPEAQYFGKSGPESDCRADDFPSLAIRNELNPHPSSAVRWGHQLAFFAGRIVQRFSSTIRALASTVAMIATTISTHPI